MSSKWRYFWGAVTITTIVGATVYAIKKSKDAEREEEAAITLAEAKEIVKRGREGDKVMEMAEEIIEERKVEAVKVSSLVYDEVLGEEYEEDEEMEDDPLRDDYPLITEDIEGPTYAVEPLSDFYYYEEGIDPKEDTELRFDPNSVDAKHQFIRMELADWNPGQDVYRILLQLFEFPFIPTNSGDELLRTQVIDYKVQFFGFGSRWVKEVSYADIVLHYARLADFNCGEGVKEWAENFLLNTELQWDSTSQEVDTMLLRLNSHTYFNEERQTFGLFGLTRESMDQAIRIANMNVERTVTYEIEFNEFLKSTL